MIKKEIRIELAKGLEARPVAVFVQVASQYDSSIFVEYRDKRVNAKSIMGTIALNMQEGQTATIIASGADEVAAVEELAAVLS